MDPRIVEFPLFLIVVLGLLLILAIGFRIRSRSQQGVALFAFGLVIAINLLIGAIHLQWPWPEVGAARIGAVMLSFWIPPTYFFYLRVFLPGEWRPRLPLLLHYVPGVVVGVALVLMSRTYDDALLSQVIRVIADFRALVLQSFYFALSIFLFLKFIKERKLNHSDPRDSLSQWILSWMLFFLLVWMADLAATLLFHRSEFNLYWSLIFAVGFTGLVARSLLASKHFDVNQWAESTNNVVLKKTLSAVGAHTNPKYAKAHFDEVDLQREWEKLRHVLQAEKFYLKANLRLSDLAKKLGLTVHQCSELINRSSQMKFYDLISSHRIDEVKRRLRDEAFAEQSILQIAYDVGFNSKSTFNAAFKKNTGLVPGEFRRRAQMGELTES
ncbi:MAG TPA: helix-turn-helix domain-containing protein [Bdellovibrionota bacterium]|nr:helix-turn-helix domain-containing protein [Bdellovibrionota bacterium]